jgi:hypothetical protein
MRWVFTVPAFSLFLALFAAVMPLHAGVVWQITGITFDDGATASGSFVYTAATNMYSAWDISVTFGPAFPAYRYLPNVDRGIIGISNATTVDILAFSSTVPSGLRFVRLQFSVPLTDAGGTVPLMTNPAAYPFTSLERDNGRLQRFVTAGSITSIPESFTPEPSSLTLVGAVLALALAVVNRRSQGGQSLSPMIVPSTLH